MRGCDGGCGWVCRSVDRFVVVAVAVFVVACVAVVAVDDANAARLPLLPGLVVVVLAM